MAELKYATDFKCNACDKQAVCFVGLNDVDGTQFPKCRKHADEWRLGLVIELSEMSRNDKDRILKKTTHKKKKK